MRILSPQIEITFETETKAWETIISGYPYVDGETITSELANALAMVEYWDYYPTVYANDLNYFCELYKQFKSALPRHKQ